MKKRSGVDIPPSASEHERVSLAIAKDWRHVELSSQSIRSISDIDKRYLRVPNCRMAGLRRTHSIPGSGGFRSQDYLQASSRKAVMVDRWGSEDKYSDGESQTLTQLSSQRTQPIAQSNHFKNILATQRHGEIISHLKQFLTTMSECSKIQSVTTLECQERLDLVFEIITKLSTDTRRQEIAQKDQLRNLEREVSNARREMKEMSEILRNKYTDNTRRKEEDTSEEFCEPVYARGGMHEPDEGICVAEYLHEVRQKRLRLDEMDSTPYKRCQLSKHLTTSDIRSMEGSDGYDDLFSDKGDSYQNRSDHSQQKKQRRNQISRRFEDSVKSAGILYEPVAQHMQRDWLRSERETTIVAVSNYEQASPQSSCGSLTVSANRGHLVKPDRKREHKPFQWGWERKDDVELEIEVIGVKRARENGRDLRPSYTQPLDESTRGTKSYSIYDNGKAASYARSSSSGAPQQTPTISYIRSNDRRC